MRISKAGEMLLENAHYYSSMQVVWNPPFYETISSIVYGEHVNCIILDTILFVKQKEVLYNSKFKEGRALPKELSIRTRDLVQRGQLNLSFT